MDELDVLRTVADRGEPRGAAAVWRAALMADSADASVAESESLRADRAALDVSESSSPIVRRRAGALLVSAAASVLIVVAGLALLRRSGAPEGNQTGGPGTTVDDTSSPSGGTGFAGLVGGVLPEGFRLVSSSRSDGIDAYSLDGEGHLLVVSVLPGGAAQARTTAPTGGPQIIDGVPAGSPSDAVLVTAAGDAIRGRCWIGDLPCEQIAAGSVVDVRPVLADVAKRITSANRDDVVSGDTAADLASSNDAEAILARIGDGGLSTGAADQFEPASSAGPPLTRTWREASNPDAIVTVRVLPLIDGVAAQSWTIGGTATASVAGEGWLVTAAARDLVSGRPPFNSEQLARIVRFGLGGLAAVPSSGDLAGSGKLTLDSTPPGWTSAVADGRDATDRSTVIRVYAGQTGSSDVTPFVTLTASPLGGQPAPDAPNVVDVNGVRGEIVGLDDRTRRLTFGPIEGVFAELDAVGISDPQLVSIAKAVERATDGIGLAVRADALPPGFQEGAVGFRGALGLTPARAVATPIPAVSWTDGKTIFSYTSFRASADVLTAYRIRLEHTQDVTINGHAAFVGGTSSYRLAGWADGDRIFLVQSNPADGAGSAIDATDLVTYASRLRPATIAEWAAMATGPVTPNGSPATTTSSASTVTSTVAS